MKPAVTKFLAAGSLLLVAAAAQAQVTFSIGPQVGYTLSSVGFTVADYPDYFSTSGAYHSGFEAGAVAQVALTRHFAVQPALLYSRQAPGVIISSYYQPNNYSFRQEYAFQFNYLALPVNLLLSEQPNGRGWQLFLGPYLGWLLGGTYKTASGAGYGFTASTGPTFSGDVVAGNTYATSNRDTNYYSRRLDAGVQVGLGYGFAALQLQASYHWGLRNIGAAYAANANNYYEAPVIHNHGFQFSAAYLFGPKS